MLAQQVNLGLDDRHGALAVVISAMPSKPAIQDIEIVDTDPYKHPHYQFREYTVATGKIIAAVIPHIPAGRYIVNIHPSIGTAGSHTTVLNIMAGELGILRQGSNECDILLRLSRFLEPQDRDTVSVTDGIWLWVAANTLLCLAAVLLLLLLYYLPDLTRDLQLMRSSTVTRGTVVSTGRCGGGEGGTSRTYDVQFVDNEGQTQVENISSCDSYIGDLSVGDSIPILYAPDDPTVIAAQDRFAEQFQFDQSVVVGTVVFIIGMTLAILLLQLRLYLMVHQKPSLWVSFGIFAGSALLAYELSSTFGPVLLLLALPGLAQLLIRVSGHSLPCLCKLRR
jgi:hypothetical protein